MLSVRRSKHCWRFLSGFHCSCTLGALAKATMLPNQTKVCFHQVLNHLLRESNSYQVIQYLVHLQTGLWLGCNLDTLNKMMTCSYEYTSALPWWHGIVSLVLLGNLFLPIHSHLCLFRIQAVGLVKMLLPVQSTFGLCHVQEWSDLEALPTHCVCTHWGWSLLNGMKQVESQCIRWFSRTTSENEGNCRGFPVSVSFV
jgi:hypothetical protein